MRHKVVVNRRLKASPFWSLGRRFLLGVVLPLAILVAFVVTFFLIGAPRFGSFFHNATNIRVIDDDGAQEKMLKNIDLGRTNALAEKQLNNNNNTDSERRIKTQEGNNNRGERLPSPIATATSIPKQPEKQKLSPGSKPTTTKTVMMQFKNVSRELKMTMRCTMNPTAPFSCCPKNTELLIIVPTRADAFDLRTAMRKAWAANIPTGARVFFLVGKIPNPRNKEESQIQQLHQLLSAAARTQANAALATWNHTTTTLAVEAERYGDLIETDVDDVYENLSVKIYAMFRWMQEFCAGVRFLLKMDDDSTVEIPRMLYWIRNKFDGLAKAEPGRLIAFGSIMYDREPVREKGEKWYVPESVYPGDKYPAYLNGPIYLLTVEAVSAILGKTASTDMMPMEDVLFTGILGEAAGVKLHDAHEHLRTYGWLYTYERCAQPSANQTEPVPYVTALSWAGASPKRVEEDFAAIHRGCKQLYVFLKWDE